MKLLFLTNNLVTRPLSEWLVKQGHTVVLTGEPVDFIMVKNDGFDLIVSYCYNHIINREIISFMQKNIVNLHIAYLPWNRGASPNYWSFFDDTPKGVTLHYIDEKLDTGDIIVQALVDLSSQKTLSDTYLKLHEEIQALFKIAFQQFRFWKMIAIPQHGAGSYHSKKDLMDQVGGQIDWNMKLPLEADGKLAQFQMKNTDQLHKV